MPLLFSYGTLQQDDVQQSAFGRLLQGHHDELPGFEPSLVKIEDARLIAAIGRTHHDNVTFNGRDDSRVSGTVFEITGAELDAADKYEQQAGYTRIAVTLASGKQAWVYLSTAIHRQVETARAGKLARVVARMPSGWAVLGDPQILPGYCLLLPDPVVPHLNSLIGAARRQFLEDMTRLGDAVLAMTGAERINYEILGNAEPALHAHVIPRYATEPPDDRRRAVWLHDWSKAPAFDSAIHGDLITRLSAHVKLIR